MSHKISDEPSYRLGKLSGAVEHSVIRLRSLLELISREKKQIYHEDLVRECQSIVELLEKVSNEVMPNEEDQT